MINLPITAFADITANVGGILNDIFPFVVILLGVVIGFYILQVVIAALIEKRQNRPQ